MPVRPVEYHPFQYPRKYRPLGYGAWEPPPPPPEPVSPGRRRRTVAVVLVALLATIVIHVGIAAAYDGNGGSPKTVVAKPSDGAAATAAGCDQQDPFNDPEFVTAGQADDSTGAATTDAVAGLRARL